MTLNEIQRKLIAPKTQFNSFGKYKYRSCEDILEAVKPLLGNDSFVTITDDIVLIGDRYYVKATATYHNGNQAISTSAFAREALDKKGMDDSQITGTASSYARKYALNGLFCIDDSKDADHADNTTKPEAKPAPKTNPKSPAGKLEYPAPTPEEEIAINSLLFTIETCFGSGFDGDKVAQWYYTLKKSYPSDGENFDKVIDYLEKNQGILQKLRGQAA